MKNFLNLIKKQDGKLIIWYFIESEIPPKPNKKNGKENLILIENKDKKSLDQKLEHNIAKDTIISKVSAEYLSFYLFYCLFYWDNYTFILVFSEPLAWPLMKQSREVEKLLSTSLDTLAKRC